MTVNRIQRVNQLIKEKIAQIILKEADFPVGVLVTVTRVNTSSDLRDSNIFVSVFPERERVKTVGFLNKKIYNFQGKINKLLRMRPVPRIKFLEEKETVEAAKIEEILEELKKEEK
ncbi:MAG: 30S ribosome-binding factor RbfA [Candidatus Pacebacteria bacterium]|nr:30S ribosome-binding factor RbfA [Candidatus Paceibacterota bacterium]